MTPSAIKSLRLSKGLTLRAFGEALGMTGKNCALTVWRWEKGEEKTARKPSPQTIRLMEMMRDETSKR